MIKDSDESLLPNHRLSGSWYFMAIMLLSTQFKISLELKASRESNFAFKSTKAPPRSLSCVYMLHNFFCTSHVPQLIQVRRGSSLGYDSLAFGRVRLDWGTLLPPHICVAISFWQNIQQFLFIHVKLLKTANMFFYH